MNDCDNEDDESDSEHSIKYQYMHWQRAARAAAKATLPQKLSGKPKARDVSTRTLNLVKAKKALDPKKNSRVDFATVQAAITESSLKDFKDWVNSRVVAMENAYAANNFHKVFSIVEKELIKKSKPPPQNIPTDGNGKILESAAVAANRWLSFLKCKFASTVNKGKNETSSEHPELQVA